MTPTPSDSEGAGGAGSLGDRAEAVWGGVGGGGGAAGSAGQPAGAVVRHKRRKGGAAGAVVVDADARAEQAAADEVETSSDPWAEAVHVRSSRPVMAKERTLQARAILRRIFAPVPRVAGQAWPVRYYGGKFWVRVEYPAPRYVAVEDRELAARILTTCDLFVSRKREGYSGWAPSAGQVNGLLEALIAYVGVSEGRMPCWLPTAVTPGGSPVFENSLKWDGSAHEGPISPGDVLELRGGLLDVGSWCRGEPRMVPHTSAWFSGSCLPFDVDMGLLRELAAEGVSDEGDGLVAAEACGRLCPTWLRFLSETFGEAVGLRDTLQEWFGYCLTSDISMQKILYLQGAPGSGKGTIREALTGVIGESNVAMTTFTQLAERFNLAPMEGCKAVFLSEARIGKRTDAGVALETLNMISGGDPVSVDQKYAAVRAAVRMACKFILTPNEAPHLPDASAALMRRLLVIPMGMPPVKPDPMLGAKIRAELAGVLVWALLGLRRLRRRGEFVQPAEGAAMMQEMRRDMSQAEAFGSDMCVVGPGNSVPTRLLYEGLKIYLGHEGHEHTPSPTAFGRQLRAAFPGVSRENVRIDGVQTWVYSGIRPRLVECAEDGKPQHVGRSAFPSPLWTTLSVSESP